MLSTNEIQLSKLAITQTRYGCVAREFDDNGQRVSDSLEIIHDDIFNYDRKVWLDPNEGDPYLWNYAPVTGEDFSNLYLKEYFIDPYNATDREVVNFLFLFPEFTGILLEVGKAWRKHESGELDLRHTDDFSVQGGECYPEPF